MLLQTVKGFKDYLPAEALKRRAVIGKITNVFEKFGFDPLETPTLEYEETLAGKYGEEEKLIYKFETPGEDKVALKYDQTVPLARVIAQYGPNGAQTITLPFKRYQIQSAYRGENTQKGRYREFLQCDGDIIGVSSPLADAEILALVYEIYQALGLKIIIKINDRALLSKFEPKVLAAMDKLNKIGKEGVIAELVRKEIPEVEANLIFEEIINLKESDNLKEIQKLYAQMGYSKEFLQYDPTLIRGLDYYTGLILEVVLVSNPNSSSLCGGGRWDEMIGKFTGTPQPAVGFAIGLDRTIEAMEEEGVMDVTPTKTKALVTIFSEELSSKSIKISTLLRSNNISAEIWLDPSDKLDKQIKYADKKSIPYVVIMGPEESEKDQVVLKNLQDRTQETLTTEELVNRLS